MANILPRHYITGIVIFTFFITGGMFLMSQLNDYNPEIGQNPKYKDFNTTFNKLDDVNSSISQIEKSIQADPDPGLFGFLNALIGTAWNSLKTITTSFSFMAGIFNGLSSFFGLPPFVGILIVLIVTVLFAFAIYSAIFQREI